MLLKAVGGNLVIDIRIVPKSMVIDAFDCQNHIDSQYWLAVDELDGLLVIASFCYTADAVELTQLNRFHPNLQSFAHYQKANVVTARTYALERLTYQEQNRVGFDSQLSY